MDKDKVRAQCNAVLPADESYVAAVPVMCGSSDVDVLARPRVLLASDQNLHLYTAGWFSVCKPKRLIATMPPGVVIVPRADPSDLRKTLDLGVDQVWVKYAYWRDLDRVVEAARELSSMRAEQARTRYFGEADA